MVFVKDLLRASDRDTLRASLRDSVGAYFGRVSGPCKTWVMILAQDNVRTLDIEGSRAIVTHSVRACVRTSIWASVRYCVRA